MGKKPVQNGIFWKPEDGFDNLIRTFILEKTVESAMDWSDSEEDAENECAESEESSED